MKASPSKSEVPACIFNDAEFAQKVKTYTDQIANCQFKVGELVWYYIQEHGNKYGYSTFDYISGITGVPDSTLRNYHNLYKLHVDFKDIPTLGNLSLSVKYQIAGLLDHPDASRLIPELAQKAVEETLTAAQVKRQVEGLWELRKTLADQAAEAAKEKAKKDKKDKEESKAVDRRPRFTVLDLGAIDNAAEAFKTLARTDVIKDEEVAEVMLEARAISLTDGIIRFMEKKVNEKQAYNLQASIELARDRFEQMCLKIRKTTKAKKGGRR